MPSEFTTLLFRLTAVMGVVISELEGVWKETFANYFQMLFKRPLERTNCGWRLELKRILKIIYEDVDWVHLAQEGVRL
jgi:hypothetical protein